MAAGAGARRRSARQISRPLPLSPLTPMQAVVIPRFGGPEVLELGDVPRPEPEPEQVLVRVHATALNRADLLQREGRYAAPRGAAQEIPGMEFAGEVVAVGRRATLWQVGA